MLESKPSRNSRGGQLVQTIGRASMSGSMPQLFLDRLPDAFKLLQLKSREAAPLSSTNRASISALAWLLKWQAVACPPSIRARNRTGTPDATCALNASGNQFEEATPSTRSGIEYPGRSTGASTNLKMSSILVLLLM